MARRLSSETGNPIACSSRPGTASGAAQSAFQLVSSFVGTNRPGAARAPADIIRDADVSRSPVRELAKNATPSIAGDEVKLLKRDALRIAAVADLPDGLLAGLQHDALAEGATLALIEPTLTYQALAKIVDAATRRQDLDAVARSQIRRWTRGAASTARDGVPARAFPGRVGPQRGRLRQRDFDLGRRAGHAHGRRAAGGGHGHTGHRG